MRRMTYDDEERRDGRGGREGGSEEEAEEERGARGREELKKHGIEQAESGD